MVKDHEKEFRKEAVHITLSSVICVISGGFRAARIKGRRAINRSSQRRLPRVFQPRNRRLMSRYRQLLVPNDFEEQTGCRHHTIDLRLGRYLSFWEREEIALLLTYLNK